MSEKLVDVIAVSFGDARVLWVMPRKTERNAEAIIAMAVARQGVEDRYFTTDTRIGKWKIGNTYSDLQEGD